MKYVKPIVNIIILFVIPIVSLFFDFKTSFHEGIATLASFTVIAIAVGLKSNTEINKVQEFHTKVTIELPGF